MSSAESAASAMLSCRETASDGSNLMPASSRPIANWPRPAAKADSDPAETTDWLDSLESVFRHSGAERAEFILSALERKAKDLGVFSDVLPFSPYRNTIPLEKQSQFPGDVEMETRITAI